MGRSLIDLSTPCSNDTTGFKVRRQQNPPIYLGHECYAWDLAIESHQGTYFETSSHVFRGGRDTDDATLDDLVLPGACLALRTGDRCIRAADLETACPDLDRGSALLIHTDADHFFSRDAAGWMARRGVKLMGSSAPRYDRGFENPTGFFVELFEAEIPIVANLIDLERLPERGFTIIALPLRITGIGTVPCRVIAILDG